jgi:hypothetical protein
MAIPGSRAAKKSREQDRIQRSIAVEETQKKLEAEGASEEDIARAKALAFSGSAVGYSDKGKADLQKQLAKNGDVMVAAGAVVTTIVAGIFPPAGAICAAGNTALAIAVAKQKKDLEAKLDDKAELSMLLDKESREENAAIRAAQLSPVVKTPEIVQPVSPVSLENKALAWYEKFRLFVSGILAEMKGGQK